MEKTRIDGHVEVAITPTGRSPLRITMAYGLLPENIEKDEWREVTIEHALYAGGEMAKKYAKEEI